MVSKKETETEAKILEAARNVFIRNGYDGARMQAIADEAGYNKSMLHYYYRDKDKLFRAVFLNVATEIFPPLMSILSDDTPLLEKIPKVIKRYLDNLNRHPFMPLFMIHELQHRPDRIREMVEEFHIKAPEKFIRQVNEAVDCGEIIPIQPEQLFINIISLCVFPFVARHMVQFVLHLSEEDFEQLLKDRETSIPNFILSALNPS